MDIQTRPLMTLRLRVGSPQIIGHTPIGDRRIVPVLDGRFEGERLRGLDRRGVCVPVPPRGRRSVAGAVCHLGRATCG